MQRISPFAGEHPLAAAVAATPEGCRMVTAEMVASVTAAPQGVFAEWPQNVIDAIMLAFERLNSKAVHTGGPYNLLTAEAGDDVGEGPYIKMVAYRYVPKVIIQ